MDNGFEIISVCNISLNKELVISLNKNGEFVIAKRIIVDDEGVKKYFYEKGSIILNKENFVCMFENINDHLNSDQLTMNLKENL